MALLSQIRLLVLVVLLLPSIAGCSAQRKPVPVGAIPKGGEVTTSEEQYGHQVLSELTNRWELEYNDPRLDELIDMVDQLTAAAGADQNPWHVYLLKAPEVKNAAATRGNHIFVWSGMLDKLKTKGEWATILSHEIAHVLAGHTDPDPNEEVKKIFINIGALAAGVAVASTTGNASVARGLGDLTSSLTRGLASELITNPYSRELELEADHVGLRIMSKAGYDPNEAIAFWRRAQTDPDFGGTNFFSTHPPAEKRLQSLSDAKPYAEAYFHGKDPQIDPNHSELPREILEKYYPPSDDSFDFRGGEKKSKFTRWRVRALKALLYSKQDRKSKPLGEFRHGAEITAVRDLGDWLEVRSPDNGYLLKEDLEKMEVK